MRYFFDGMFVLNFVWKARRKDKDAAAPSQEEPKLYLESAVLECTVPEAKLRDIVGLPDGLEYNEWLASHTLAFFEHINLIYGTISEFCTMSGCPDMTGPGNRQYLWFDEKGKKCKVAAPQYIDYVMTFTQKTVNDESIFPTKFDKDFPSSFESIVKKIHRLLFHVLAHIYHAHFREIVLLNLHAHLNCIFSHLMLFNEQFKLIDEKETEVLHDLALALKLFPKENESGNLEEGATKDGSSAAGTTSSGTSGEDGDSKAESQSPEKKSKGVNSSFVIDSPVRATGRGLERTDGSNTSCGAADVTSSSSNNQGGGRRSPSTSSGLASSHSIPSSLTALHTRVNSSGSHSNSTSCAMDSALFAASSSSVGAATTAPPCGSSPLKFQ